MKSQPRGRARLEEMADMNERSMFISDPSFAMIDLVFDAISPVSLQSPQMIMEKMS